ncbi:MAG: hypothetical protein EAZ70_01380 [Runella slithyformis]|nr:MAG: hypothetical protein EAY79_01585 [Runella slithyformis]TAE94939.1 MAG: hypothetical protein EAZ80_09825 [Runella slithyformis]TAF29635.1 MAG: hypothetical protein EAZ70_01380 [Runella slithyformis]TAF48471.1 MAG: hypothetical protein EAZ63_04835 [Runella slithyformis]TAF83045.1 MAG: hypothetical protein EAZ50_02630 [Runella slithyformis]
MLCIETICLADGQLKNLAHHNARLNRSRGVLYGSCDQWDLAQLISLPKNTPMGVFKCRVVYGEALEKIEFEPYVVRPIKSLKLIEANHLDYAFKYQNRHELQALYAQRGLADDVLIIKNGFVTDTSYANVAFFDGQHWLTPALPLLAGTRRAQLLQEGAIVEKKIRVQELSNFSRTRIFNSMVDFEILTLFLE